MQVKQYEKIVYHLSNQHSFFLFKKPNQTVTINVPIQKAATTITIIGRVCKKASKTKRRPSTLHVTVLLRLEQDQGYG